MQRILILSLVLGVGVVVGRMFDGVPSTAEAGGGQGVVKCATINGDVNADDTLNIADAISILGNLFLGEPSELAPLCETQDNVGCETQDSEGCPSEDRFVDHGDGTVTDTCTGLMWQQDTGNNGNAVALGRALVYCENLELAGHDDWRLPNLRELLSIVDHGRVDPSIDPVFGALSSFYWSSTRYAPAAADHLWTLYFGSGFFTNDGISALNNIRAVRRGP